MQPRRIARELALLSASQYLTHRELGSAKQLSNMVLAAVRMLTITELKARGELVELQRGSDQPFETRATDLKRLEWCKGNPKLTQSCDQPSRYSSRLPELIQLANHFRVQRFRTYALGCPLINVKLKLTNSWKALKLASKSSC